MKSLNCIMDLDATYYDLLSCLFNMNDLEVSVLKYLRNSGRKSLDDLADYTKRNRSTVFKALGKQVSMGLVNQYNEPLKNGGRVSYYSAVATEKMLDMVKRKRKEICDSFDKLILKISSETV